MSINVYFFVIKLIFALKNPKQVVNLSHRKKKVIMSKDFIIKSILGSYDLHFCDVFGFLKKMPYLGLSSLYIVSRDQDFKERCGLLLAVVFGPLTMTTRNPKPCSLMALGHMCKTMAHIGWEIVFGFMIVCGVGHYCFLGEIRACRQDSFIV